MAKQRKHQGLRADGKLRKGFKYSGKRNKNGTARIVKVVQKKKMKGGECPLDQNQAIFNCKDAQTEINAFNTKWGDNPRRAKEERDKCTKITRFGNLKKLYCAKFEDNKAECRMRKFTSKKSNPCERKV